MVSNDKAVRVRIAPSPTGDLHVGNAYIALFDFCFARASGGKFVLRIEDTDRTRSSATSEQTIFDGLHWLGLNYDEGPDVGGDFGPYRQSERLQTYRKEIGTLLDSRHAYYCFCTPERLAEVRAAQQDRKESSRYDRHCRDLDREEAQRRIAAGQRHVVRLAVPLDGETTFHDRLRGPVTFQNQTIDDQVLIKSDGFPTYHLASVVDDHLMEITHVCRAEEWITSTPKHVLLYEAFGWEVPEFIHMPLLRNPDRSKISKRKNPTSLSWYRDEGYLPEALLNFLGLMGYSMPDGRQVFSLGEMIESFSWDRVNTGGPIFDMEKLHWLNGEYIRAMDAAEFVERIRRADQVPADAPREKLLAMAPMVQERVKRLSEVADCTAYFWQELPYEADRLLPQKKGKPTRTAAETRAVLEQVRTVLEQLSDWTTAAMETAMRAYCEESQWKVREVFMGLRVAVTGRTISAPLFETMEVLGRAESITRLGHAIAKLT